jgi:long-chain acyl-CoA synthetase
MTEPAHQTRPWHAHYDAWVPPHQSYPLRPLHEILATTAKESPEAAATAFLGATLTFAELKARADRLSAALAHHGIRKGDHIGIMLPNCPQYIIGAFAILRLGAVIVNVNPAYTAREAVAIAADAGLRALITLTEHVEFATTLQAAIGLRMIIVTSLAEYSAAAVPLERTDGTLSLSDLIGGAPAADLSDVAIEPDDIAVLQYSSGTSGAARAAMLTHANIFANVVQTETFMYPSRPHGERYLLVIPLFHIYAFTVGMMKGIRVGAQLSLHAKYDVEQTLAAIRDFQPTYFPAVPTIYVSLLMHPMAREYGVDCVRHYNTGGSPCPLDVLERWEALTGRPLNEGYGLSEASPVTHSTPQFSQRRAGTVGVPIPDTDMKIVDVVSGTRELPMGEVGELCVAGPQVMKGYWNQPEESGRVLRPDPDGRVWLHTGDLARVDAAGFTTIVQRKTDMLIVDGFNVFPSEIERVLCAHPAVRQAAVIGVADAYHGEVPKALVILRDGAAATGDQIAAHCRTQLAEYKVPRRIEFRDSFPVSSTGKILYRELRTRD